MLARLGIFSVLAGLVMLAPQIARACSSQVPDEHQLDPDEGNVDEEAPGEIVEVSYSVSRGEAPKCCNGICSTDSCADIGQIVLTIEAGEDDRTPTDELGYRVELIDGDLPKDFSLIDYDFRLMDGAVYLDWADGAVDDQDDFSFTLAVAAVDLAGNVGPATEIEISDVGETPANECDYGGECSIAPDREGFGGAVLMAMLFFGASVRLRSRRQHG